MERKDQTSNSELEFAVFGDDIRRVQMVCRRLCR